MSPGHKVSCVLCQRHDETKITGALATKDQVTAHQNCLLFSSGIFCRDSPQFDDLFGFSVEDVMDEVRRGSKLVCDKCKKKGATAGCEVKRCKKSYHYPCAVTAGAKTVEDVDGGCYGLYCFKHCQQEKGSSANGHAASSSKVQTSKVPNDAGTSKVHCPACEKTEGNISLDSLSNSIVLLYCDKHAPASHKKNTSGDSTAAGPSACSSNSSSLSCTKRFSKRQLSFKDKQEEIPSKCKYRVRKRILSDDSADSDMSDADLEMFAPLESDIEGSANSVFESQTVSKSNRKVTESPAGSPSGNQLANESRDVDDDMDADSESLLPPAGSSMESEYLSKTSAAQTTPTAPTALPPVVTAEVTDEASPVHSPAQHTAGPSVPQQSSFPSPPPPGHSKPRSVTGLPPCTSSAISPAPPEPIFYSPGSPASSPSGPEPKINSTSFWRSCNAAECTQAIFADFINEMNDISGRIQSDQASQEDYDFALKVMEASGKLAELVTKQQKVLQTKQMELEKAAAAMKEVVSALKR